MKKFIFTLITILLLFIPGFSFPQDSVPDTIVYGGDEAFPPYEFMNKKGKPEGFNIDLIRAIGKEMGFKVMIKLAPWKEISDELEQKNTVQVVSMYFSEKRTDMVDFASPTELSYYELYLRKGENKFTTLEDLKGKKVAIEAGSVIEEYFTEHYTGIKLLQAPSELAALEMLSSGKCYAAFASSIINYNMIRTLHLDNIMKFHKPFLPRLYSFAVKKGNDKLLRLINIGLLRTQEDGTFHKLRDNWINYRERVWFAKNFYWVLLIITLLIIWFIIWIVFLRFTVNKKTKELKFANFRLGLIARFKATRIDKLSAQEQISELLEHIRETFEADACIVSVINDGQLELFGSVGINDENAIQSLPMNIGFGKKIIESKKAIAVSNVAMDKTHLKAKKEFPNIFPFSSYAGAPLISEGKVIGIIGVYSSKKNREFSSLELEHFQIVADQLAVSFENARLFEQNEKQKEILVKQIVSRKAAEAELQKSFQMANTLYEITKELSISLDIITVGQHILKSLEKLLKWQRGSIWLMNENNSKILLIAHADMGLKGNELEKEIKKVKAIAEKQGGIVGWVTMNGKNIRSGNVKTDERYLETDPKVISELCVPIILSERSIGCINVESFEENAFSEEDEKLLTTLSNLSASAIQNARLFEKLNFELKERTKAEKEVEKLNRGLEIRVGQRTEELQAINKELESFVYSISHDLRAPLRSIAGFSEIISRRYKESLNEEGREYFGYILEATGNMTNLINDLLQFSRLAKNLLSKKPIDLDEVIEKVKHNLNHDIKEKKATIVLIGKMPVVNGDKSLVGQIFSNLIQNAIEYHRKGIDPEIVISAVDSDKHTIIKVKDNGQGIPEEHFEKIFDIFQRLHSNDEYPGTGIGLAIVKKAIKALGGEISLESEVGVGTTFFVKFSKN